MNGICLYNGSTNNQLISNILSWNNAHGIGVHESSNNNILLNNNISKNNCGIGFTNSSYNTICHNNFINNVLQVINDDSINIWDNGYPSGGNYWSDHNPPDIYSGPNQDIPGSDGIGDIPYTIDGNNADRYPLIYSYGYVPSPDFNDDGIVDILDVLIVASAFGTKSGDPNWSPVADIKQDGIINIIDLVIIGVNFGKRLPL